MCTTACFCRKRYQRLAPALQLFFAALYAFVLPFICAGAQATPGHPHARAHFVFLEPELAHHLPHSSAMDDMDNEMSTMHSAHLATATEPERNCLLHSNEDSPLPAGRSVSMQLVTGSLLLLGSSLVLVPLLTDAVGFSVWLAHSIVAPVDLLVPTPPPR